MNANGIQTALDLLMEQGFISGWRKDGRRWWVDYPGAYRSYTKAEMIAWLEGVDAMGASTF